ncbi:hypothetical protein WMF31_34680 [Sorangium sp. So ce1036]|uniref:hypothetical protein n=1 Tax=Sorangium sp. So ce1036 TaxID=3133328 RepID=UPI003EFEDF19
MLVAESMRSRFDALGKNVLRDTLARVGAADTDVEVIIASQTIDVWYVPDPTRATARAELGLLGKLAADPCQFEPFHGLPSQGALRGCVRKQLHRHHELERRAGGEVPFPRLCVLSSGQPATVLDAVRFEPEPGRAGLYRSVPDWRIDVVVVIAELPRTRETLLVRLLGARRAPQRHLGPQRPARGRLGEEHRPALAGTLALHQAVDPEQGPEGGAAGRAQGGAPDPGQSVRE